MKTIIKASIIALIISITPGCDNNEDQEKLLIKLLENYRKNQH